MRKHCEFKVKAVLVAGLAAILLAVPNTAEAATKTVTVPAHLQDRAKMICARISNLIIRTENQMARLPAGPETKGSIAWLKAKAEQAKARGNTDRATVLTNRANVLTQKLALLPNQKAALQQAQQSCESMGYIS